MYRKRKSKFKKAVIYIITAFLCLFILFSVFLLNVVNPVIASVCDIKLKTYTTLAFREGLLKTIEGSLNYNDLISVERDRDGNIAAVYANSMTINRLARDTAAETALVLGEMLETPIQVPLGTLSGIIILSGMGKTINVNVIDGSTVDCFFYSEFESAGINQTRHKIYMEVISGAVMFLPFKNMTITSKSVVLICETLLVGKIPHLYFNGSLGGNLNLIP